MINKNKHLQLQNPPNNKTQQPAAPVPLVGYVFIKKLNVSG